MHALDAQRRASRDVRLTFPKDPMPSVFDMRYCPILTGCCVA